MDILSLGEPLIEFNQQPDGRWLEGFGGDTSNVAIAAARQGAATGVMTRVGADRFGEALRGLWAREGVSDAAVVDDPLAPTGIYFVHHGEDGHAFSYRRAGSAASFMRPGTMPLKEIAKAKILHLSGISLAISDSAADTCFAAVKVAREAGVTVSFDLNYRPALWPLERARAVIHEMLRFVDIALPGLDDGRRLTGLSEPEAIVSAYRDLGPPVVALTLGADGVLVGEGADRHDVPPRRTTLVDASGAGDCFDGAFLARWLTSRDVAASARYANAAASLKVEGYGAIHPIPRSEAVSAALAG